MDTLKLWYARIIRSKTMWLAAILSALGALQAGTEAFTPYFGAKAVGVLTVIVGIAVGVLRTVTNKDLEDK